MIEFEELQKKIHKLQVEFDNIEGLPGDRKTKAEIYCRIAQQAEQYQNLAAEYKVRQERKCGQLLREIESLRTEQRNKYEQLLLGFTKEK